MYAQKAHTKACFPVPVGSEELEQSAWDNQLSDQIPGKAGSLPRPHGSSCWILRYCPPLSSTSPLPTPEGPGPSISLDPALAKERWDRPAACSRCQILDSSLAGVMSPLPPRGLWEVVSCSQAITLLSAPNSAAGKQGWSGSTQEAKHEKHWLSALSTTFSREDAWRREGKKIKQYSHSEMWEFEGDLGFTAKTKMFYFIMFKCIYVCMCCCKTGDLNLDLSVGHAHAL